MLPLEGKRIFIVEDNLTNRAIMQTILEQAGATISFERWGRDTERKLRQFGEVDCILLDLMFPHNVTGLDVYDKIRALPEYDDVPIIAVSAKDPDIAIPETQAKGFAGFIGKPINMTRFSQQISDILEGASIWQPA